jgi:hypothetical protein
LKPREVVQVRDGNGLAGWLLSLPGVALSLTRLITFG